MSNIGLSPAARSPSEIAVKVREWPAIFLARTPDK